VLLYPFFENHPMLDVTMYALLISFATAGRLFGGLMHYVVKIPTHLRFKVAAIVYFSLNIISGILLFTNYYFMIALQFLMGLLSINSFNIRMSSVQSYVPSEKRVGSMVFFKSSYPWGCFQAACWRAVWVSF
jgi:MFS transporter, DHA3 family, macrolide efflux protein